MYVARTPAILKPLWKELVWNVPGASRTVHLTFDDGPVPGVTPWVLDTLAEYGAKATFFCIGRHAQAEPALMQRIRDEGHGVGNHTWDHPNGWKVSTTEYLRSVLRCQAFTGTRLFRPPYGRISRSQVKALRCRFEIVMWEVLSGDFDAAIDADRCLRNVTRNVRAGSIVVFHDSVKAWDRLEHALPRTLEHLHREGFVCAAMPGSQAWQTTTTIRERWT